MFAPLVVCLSFITPAAEGPRGAAGPADWPAVGGDRGGTRFSELDQIDRSNVRRLERAWVWHTGDLADRAGKTIECTPVVADGTMYVTTNYLRVAALDAATGEERWSFDPLREHPHPFQPTSGGVNRGVAWWSDGEPNGARRILHGTSDGRLFSLDARTGAPDPNFGEGGVRDLRTELPPAAQRLPYGPTSAPAIYEDVVILGVSNGEGPGIAAPGDVRAFDVRTGAQLWSFRTVPAPGEFGHDTWAGDSWQNRGGANAWGGINVDVDRGLVFCGTGSAAFDFYGGDRQGANLFANCVLALNARTGERVWHFQTLHHDLWDHDLPTPPVLATVERDGEPVDAAAQVTKTGHLFLFNRATGDPLFGIEERPVPPSDVPGERAWPTQPRPVKPPPFAAQTLDESNLTNVGAANRESALEQLKQYRHGPGHAPPSLQGTIVTPGTHGGANWSGAAFDPTRDYLIVNSTNVPNIMRLVPASANNRYRYGHAGYDQFRDHEGYPAIAPPWGLLTAIDLNTGEFAWQVPLGEYPKLTARGVPQTGTENFGGPIVTAGGLVFIAGTKDERLRAFDAATGEELWSAPLPAGGYATPCTYAVNGRQYVAVAAGGAGKLRTKPGDAFVAFALPEE